MDGDFPPFPLEKSRVAIVGVGLMGGSLALALRGRVAALYLADPDPETRALARAWGLGDTVAAHPEEAVRHADVILLAAPIRAMLEIIPRLAEWVHHPAVVMDVGSTKVAVCRAFETLPPRFDPIGAHPLAGKTHQGLSHADPRLFAGRPFVLSPLPRTGPRAKGFAQTLVTLLNARPVWMAPETHDRLVAFTSHAPYLLSLALTLAAPGESRAVFGPGFESGTRLAGSSPRMMLDIMMTNLDAVLEALEAVETVLEQARVALEQGREADLYALFQEALERHRKWFSD